MLKRFLVTGRVVFYVNAKDEQDAQDHAAGYVDNLGGMNREAFYKGGVTNWSVLRPEAEFFRELTPEGD